MANEKDMGALWLKTSKSGDKFFSGTVEINGEKHGIVIFKNNYKQKENQPDYRIFPQRERGESPQVSAAREVFQDDIPF